MTQRRALFPVGTAHPAEPDFEALVREHRPALLRWFQNQLSDPAEAEDLTQDVLMRLSRLPDISAIRDLRAYLFEAARNSLRDRFQHDRVRHRDQHVSFDPALGHDLSQQLRAPSEERVAEARQVLDGFLEAMNELTPKTRSVFMLNRFDGLSYPAIAARFGISVSAVEKHMMRALAMLAARLGSDE